MVVVGSVVVPFEVVVVVGSVVVTFEVVVSVELTDIGIRSFGDALFCLQIPDVHRNIDGSAPSRNLLLLPPGRLKMSLAGKCCSQITVFEVTTNPSRPLCLLIRLHHRCINERFFGK